MTHEELLLFGGRLRQQRNARHYTQEQLADALDISLRFYQMLERGEKPPSLNLLVRISKTLNISADYLLFGDLSAGLEHPITKIFQNLSPRQKMDAVRILQLYAQACKDQPDIKSD